MGNCTPCSNGAQALAEVAKRAKISAEGSSLEKRKANIVLRAWKSRRTMNGIRLLFEACQEDPPSYDRIRMLVQAKPELVSSKRLSDDCTPLHCAIQGSLEVVKCLVDAWPNAVKYRRTNGDILLHWAARYATVDVVKFLVEQWPRALKQRTVHGEIPLHFAIKGAHPDVFVYLLQAWEKSALTLDDTRTTVLHKVLSTCEAPLIARLVPALLETWPGASGHVDKHGKLPLHVAISKGADLDTIRRLVEARPAALWSEDIGRNVPLHLELSSGFAPRPEVVRYLVECWPEATLHENREDKVPLELYAETHFPYEDHFEDILAALVYRRRPLHFMCHYLEQLPWSVFQRVLSEHPETLTVPNRAGFLPWQQSCFQSCLSLSVTYEFLRRCRDTLRVSEKGRRPSSPHRLEAILDDRSDHRPFH